MLTIEEIQAELQEEINLCNKYFIEEDMHKESTEHERLALKIVTMCMQTLSALKDGELEELKFIRQWKSDIMDSFCKYDVSSFEELVTNTRTKAIDDFVKSIRDIVFDYYTNEAYIKYNDIDKEYAVKCAIIKYIVENHYNINLIHFVLKVNWALSE